MKKYSVLVCCLLLCGCMGHRHAQQRTAALNAIADCSSHDDEIDCSWNVPDKP
ncbi:hypothetical protein [Erwinia sp. 198]|uniref:hypothetical protein n=1 Tax=Erwinia sp. 198 TaxID=2022746 RepID=UPI001315696E|nr:hypothetical protein [Erwinia sp. 198]